MLLGVSAHVAACCLLAALLVTDGAMFEVHQSLGHGMSLQQIRPGA